MAFPVETVHLPAVLTGQKNGKLAKNILVDVPGQQGGPTVRLVAPAALAWRALCATARDAGHVLKAVSATDSYRPFEVQERIFRERYTTDGSGPKFKTWLGMKWYKLPGEVTAAVPGTSNHGRGLAVDVGEERDSHTGVEPIDRRTLDWLLDNELRFGFSHELQDESWHIRYYAGDSIPDAVLKHGEDDDMALGEDIYRLLHEGKRPPGTSQTSHGGIPIAWIVREIGSIKTEQGKAQVRDEIMLRTLLGEDDKTQILAHIDDWAGRQLAAVKSLRADLARELAADFLDVLRGQVDPPTEEQLKLSMDVALRQVIGRPDVD